MNTRPLITASVTMLAGLTGACSAPGISARMDDAQVREVLGREAPVGATEGEVRAALDRLGAPASARGVYAASGERPRVLLQRLYESGGWISTDDDDVKFLDVSFVFTPQDRLERTLLYRDKVRYVQGEAVIYPHAPRRRLARHPGVWTGGLPPPVDPLEGAR